MTSCPTCGGRIDQLVCNGCAHVFKTSDLLGKFPPPEKVARVQEDKLDFGIREAG